MITLIFNLYSTNYLCFYFKLEFVAYILFCLENVFRSVLNHFCTMSMMNFENLLPFVHKPLVFVLRLNILAIFIYIYPMFKAKLFDRSFICCLITWSVNNNPGFSINCMTCELILYFSTVQESRISYLKEWRILRFSRIHRINLDRSL